MDIYKTYLIIYLVLTKNGVYTCILFFKHIPNRGENHVSFTPIKIFCFLYVSRRQTQIENKPRFHQHKSVSLSKINLSPSGSRKNNGRYFLIIIDVYPYITHNKNVVKYLRFWNKQFPERTFS